MGNREPVGLKVPPHSIDAEQSVLGGVMLNPQALDEIVDVIAEADFYRSEHRLTWAAVRLLEAEGGAIDVVTVSEKLQRSGDLEAVGGLAYLASLANNTPGTANIRAYARVVKDRAIERSLLAAAVSISEHVYGEGETKDKLDHAQSLLMQISDKRETQGPVTARSILPAVIDDIDKRTRSGGGLLGLATGFLDIDSLTSGLQPSDLVIIAGRPSMGKTSLAMGIAEHVSISLDQPVLVFSMEMGKTQIISRLCASVARIDFQRMRTGKMLDHEWPMLSQAVGTVNKAQLLIDDSPALTVLDLRARARRAKRQHGLSLIIVDYLQLMSGDGDNRNEEISRISRGLKALAKELNVPVIALSQLNRSVETRSNKRPVMSDLRESGAIEQDADLIMFLYRDEVYNEDTSEKGIAEVIVSKQRNGPIGTRRLLWVGNQCRFDNYTGAAIEEGKPGRWSGGME